MIKGVVALISEERLAGFRTGFLVRSNRWSEVINEAGKGIRRAVAGIAACWDVLASVNKFVMEELICLEIMAKAVLEVAEIWYEDL